MSFHLNIEPELALTNIRLEDAEAMTQLLNNERMSRYMLRVPHPYTRDDAKTFIGLVLETEQQQGHPRHFAIRGVEDVLCGVVGFDHVHYEHRAEVGYWMGEPFWGRGYMTRAVATACAHVLEQWKLRRISAHVFVGNQSSEAVLQRCGFELEGRLRNYLKKGGRLIDTHLYALIP